MKNIEWVVNFLVKLIFLVLFVFFSFYKMKENLLVITIELLLFSFINSFIIENKKIKFDFEIFSFQAITVFYLERREIFLLREVPEEMFDNYDYIKLLFVVVFMFVFVFLFFKSKNEFLKKYFFCLFSLLFMIQNILELYPVIPEIPVNEDFLGMIYIGLLIWEVAFSYLLIDIVIIGALVYLLSEKNKNFLYVYFFMILCFFLRHLTEKFY